MECEGNFKEELRSNFDLLCSIVRQNTSEHSFTVDLSKIDVIIQKKIPETLKKNAPEDFYVLYSDFQAEYQKFRDFILYENLIGKNIVAVGGGFSSGKSSFLNSLMGVNVLPEDINPSTSVPTYIVSGQSHTVTGINVFDTKVKLNPRDLRKIAHGFGELSDDESKVSVEGVTLGHVLESVFFSTKFHRYANLAFLDTPGYSKPDDIAYSAKTDAQIARRQLNTGNYILWFVQADAGILTEEDIQFIKTLREDTPKLFIINKADKKELSDLQKIIAKIRSTLEVKGIRYVDVLAYSSKSDDIFDDALTAFIKENKEKLKQYLDSWNQRVCEANFARNFKQLFVRCKDFYEDEIEEEQRKLSRLNTSLTKLINESVSSDITEPLEAMVKEASKNVTSLKEIKKKLKELQDEFFSEIKYIADVVGISMPEPSEIDLLQDKVQNPMQLIEEYRKKKGIKASPEIAHMLQDMFDGIKPVINRQQGGIAYKNELADVILSLCSLKPSEIHINDCFANSPIYTELIRKTKGN